jgi:hypothetical protein
VGTSRENLCTLIIASRWILLRMRNISDKSCRENQNTHFMFNNFFSENRAVYVIMWKNMVQPDGPEKIHIACWIIKAIETLSEYIILVTFPRRQRLRERVWTLHYTHIACLVIFFNQTMLQHALWNLWYSVLSCCVWLLANVTGGQKRVALSGVSPNPAHTFNF